MKLNSESRIALAGPNGYGPSSKCVRGTRLFCLVAVCLLLDHGAPLTAGDLSPASLWKARALGVGKRMQPIVEQIQSLPEAARESEKAKELKAVMMLEMAFGLHMTHESVVHKTEGGYEFFHLLLRDGDSALDLVYMYSEATGELIGTRVSELPKGWKLMFAKQAPNVLHVETPGPTGFAFLFDLTDPFTARVAAYPD